MHQTVIYGLNSTEGLGSILESCSCKKYMLVCGSSFSRLDIGKYFAGLSVPHVTFSDFKPNPRYEDVCRATELFRREECNCIVAVGGGSAIDVAKCVKLFAPMDPAVNYLAQSYTDSRIPLIALPTTAGTGSESTHFAVIYAEGKKHSIAHESLLPNYAILEPSVLASLPVYQKKCTLLDALCQAIESWWSVRSSEESGALSRRAIELMMKYQTAYLLGSSDEANGQIMLAANLAGQAINLTTTTAAHAMSYKLTTVHGLPHGHAVAVCLPPLWRYMAAHTDLCNDPRGQAHLERTFAQIASALGARSVSDAIELLESMLAGMGIEAPRLSPSDLPELVASVNPARLGNNPVKLSPEALAGLYRMISKE